MAIHGLAHTLPDRGLDHVRAQVEHGNQLSSLQAVEITQNMVFRPSPGRPADTHPAAREVRASAVLHHRAQPVVACCAAADLEPRDPKIEVELVGTLKNRMAA